jgi:phosphatidate cytidylyltransferase
MDGGMWWFLVALPATWWADVGAFFIGSALGRHPMSRRVSPKKTWEGYFGGIIISIGGTIGLAALWQIWGSPVTAGQAAIIALVMSALTPLGDLSESVFKRQAGVKDSGSLLPGHGGFFDRVDSWLWAGVIAYYLITFLWV